MKLKMYNDCAVTELYVLDITPEYCKSIENYLKSRAINPNDVPEITEEIVSKAYNNTDETLEIKCGRDDREYTEELYQFIRDCLYDDIWDNFYEDVGSESYGQEWELVS